jgi:AAA domain
MPIKPEEVEAAKLVFQKSGKAPRVVTEHGLPVADVPANLIVCLADFLAGFVAPDYLLDGILQRRFVYSLTAQTGHGKTALALLIARLVGGSDSRAALGRHGAEKGQVVYFAGENPDDLRMRVLGDENLYNDDTARISFIPGTFSIEAMRARIEAEMTRRSAASISSSSIRRRPTSTARTSCLTPRWGHMPGCCARSRPCRGVRVSSSCAIPSSTSPSHRSSCLAAAAPSWPRSMAT